MNLAAFALRNRTTTLVLTVVLLVGGIASFNKLSRLEDPEFTIKEALVITPYPGASAAEVEEEVSDKIEQAVQQLAQLKEVESKSDRGLSTVTVRIKEQLRQGQTLPQVWDELRRKVERCPGEPPSGSRSLHRGGRLRGRVSGILHRGLRGGVRPTSRTQGRRRQFLRRELLLVEGRGQDRSTSGVRHRVPSMSSSTGTGCPSLGISARTTIMQSSSSRQEPRLPKAGRVEVGPELYRHRTLPELFDSVEAFEGPCCSPEGRLGVPDLSPGRGRRAPGLCGACRQPAASLRRPGPAIGLRDLHRLRRKRGDHGRSAGAARPGAAPGKLPLGIECRRSSRSSPRP